MPPVKTPRTLLRDRLDASAAERAEIARAYTAPDFAGRPQDGVRLFFPAIQRTLFNQNIGYASDMLRVPTNPSVLQLLLLGLPLLVDLRPDFASSPQAFRDHYGMSLANFAGELHTGDIIAIINDRDPLTSWSDDALDCIRPLLTNPHTRIEFAHYSLNSYIAWALSDKQLQDIGEEGARLYKEYFACGEDELAPLAKALRVSDPTPATIRNAVMGRWRNIVSLKPDVGIALERVFHELRHDTPVARAAVLNGMKHFLASSVTVGRGGAVRPSPAQIADMRTAHEVLKRHKELKGAIHAEPGAEYWAGPVVKKLEKICIVPGRDVLDYKYYRELTRHAFFEEFKKRARKLGATLSFTTADRSVAALDQCLAEWDDALAEQYAQAKKWTRPVEKYGGPFVSIVTSVAEVKAPGASILTARVVEKGADWFVKQPGWQLHQLVRRAARRGWPADATLPAPGLKAR